MLRAYEAFIIEKRTVKFWYVFGGVLEENLWNVLSDKIGQNGSKQKGGGKAAEMPPLPQKDG